MPTKPSATSPSGSFASAPDGPFRDHQDTQPARGKLFGAAEQRSPGLVRQAIRRCRWCAPARIAG